MSSGIYVLELEGGNYYVGKSSVDIDNRIRTHFNGRGSEWTKLYEPIEVKEKLEISDNLEEYERWMTMKMMIEFGWESVRGAGWSNIEMSNPPNFCQ